MAQEGLGGTGWVASLPRQKPLQTEGSDQAMALPPRSL